MSDSNSTLELICNSNSTYSTKTKLGVVSQGETRIYDNYDYYEEYIPKDILNNITDKNIRDKIYKTVCDKCPPKGISKDIWIALEDSDKEQIVRSTIRLQQKKGHMTIYQKFLERLVETDDIEPSINTLTLICALILGAPFTIASFYGQEQFTYMKDTLSNCPDDSFYVKSKFTWGYTQSQILGNWSCTVYGAMVGLLLSAVYYALRPNKTYMIKWIKVKGKIFVGSMVLTTGAAIISLMNLTADILNYTIVATDLCDANVNQYFIPGIFFLIFSIFYAFFLML